MGDNVSLPISIDWSKEEIVDVVNFYEAVDKAYNKGVDKDLLLALYYRFKEVVPGKADEKKDFKLYEEQTNQSPYHVVKKAKELQDTAIVKMN
ncbi:uncharacterized protein YktA (UPF0223 family) [Evansella vedderi]|uniref:Uncharacterized protein YktA (UPF0223 family) n=1 Tax=Evansella vedderi TaxID=38282 RepID=A0ABT9ZUQ3_9BACI|nr:UPF0223 family protein [Evansella vedderi]MDQ0253870.1 uncharacterized protein YktA (UPF0223 family) [Evansella vedderi]